MNLKFPIPVQRALRKLGQDIQDARKRRRIPTRLMAERAGITRVTLHKIEKGEPGVGIGHVVTVLFVLGMVDKVLELADIKHDELGLLLEETQLPQRIHGHKIPKDDE